VRTELRSKPAPARSEFVTQYGNLTSGVEPLLCKATLPGKF
jgi:hypothetical protein